MSNLKNKSDLSFISAELLKKEGYHHSSIHCSYYGLFQKMKYTIKNLLNITYDDYYSRSRLSTFNSHAFLINLLCDEIKTKGYCQCESQILKRKILELKELRETADYDNIVMTSINSDDAFDLGRKILNEIKTKFQL